MLRAIAPVSAVRIQVVFCDADEVLPSACRQFKVAAHRNRSVTRDVGTASAENALAVINCDLTNAACVGSLDCAGWAHILGWPSVFPFRKIKNGAPPKSVRDECMSLRIRNCHG